MPAGARGARWTLRPNDVLREVSGMLCPQSLAFAHIDLTMRKNITLYSGVAAQGGVALVCSRGGAGIATGRVAAALGWGVLVTGSSPAPRNLEDFNQAQRRLEKRTTFISVTVESAAVSRGSRGRSQRSLPGTEPRTKRGAAWDPPVAHGAVGRGRPAGSWHLDQRR